MTTQEKPGCLASLLQMLGIGKQDNGFTFREDESEKLEPEILPYHLRDDFLSNAETSFFQVLKTMTGNHLIICPQVSLSAVFFVSRGESFQAYQNKIDRKRVDFLLCDSNTLKPLLAIELDDSSHARPDRQERDSFVEDVFEAARLPLVHIPVQQSYNTRELGALFQAALQRKSVDIPIETPPAGPQVEPPLCPKCGLPLVLRTAHRGNTPGKQFYGCQNYPRCRVVVPLKESST
jgi:hypothetical protein